MTEEREVIWASRPGHFSPGEGYVQPDESSQPTLNVAPLSVAGKLREGLFDGRTVMLTSATLAIGAAFEPVAGALGLRGRRRTHLERRRRRQPLRLSQAGHAVCGQAPAQARTRRCPRRQLDEIEALIKASGGGALALFSSRRAAEDAAEILRARLDIPILCQGEST